MIVLITTHAEDSTGHLGTSAECHVDLDEVRGLTNVIGPISQMTVDGPSGHETALGSRRRSQRTLVLLLLRCTGQHTVFPGEGESLCL